VPLARIRRTIAARALIPRGTLVLCACSGGPDSAALMFALARLSTELDFQLEVAAVDHGLRPEAAAEVAIAGRQAAGLGLTFHALQAQVAPGASLQAQARTARYAALQRLAAARGAGRVAVGHTRDDQAETVLLRLIRGSGLLGLRAIEPQRGDGVIRPLIDCSRQEVHQLARAHFSELVHDPSNLDPRFGRVRLRAHVIPLLLAENPRLTEHLAALADEAQLAGSALDWAVAQALERARIGPRCFRPAALADRPLWVRRAALRAWLVAEGLSRVSRAHLHQLERAVRLGRGHVWLAHGFHARLEPDGLLRLHESQHPARTEP